MFSKRMFLVFITMLALTAVCFAAPRSMPQSIPNDELAIGGIHLHDSEEYILSIYGEPDDITYSSSPVFGEMKKCNYGGSFFVTYHPSYKDGSNIVLDVKTTANNGLKTPPGFTVGSPLAGVIEYYGSSNWSRVKESNGKKSIMFWDGEYKLIRYEANHEGKIESISLYQNP